jgi:hypothetical protein
LPLRFFLRIQKALSEYLRSNPWESGQRPETTAKGLTTGRESEIFITKPEFLLQKPLFTENLLQTSFGLTFLLRQIRQILNVARSATIRLEKLCSWQT